MTTHLCAVAFYLPGESGVRFIVPNIPASTAAEAQAIADQIMREIHQEYRHGLCSQLIDAHPITDIQHK